MTVNFLEYMNLVSEKIGISGKISGLSPHRPDIGTNREAIVTEFFNKHLPPRLWTCIGGQVINMRRQISGQIDILILSDLTWRFGENERPFGVVEGLAAAVSVKSTLDKRELLDALANLASIPQIEGDCLEFRLHPQGNQQAVLDIYKANYPSLYIFAYDGMQYASLKAHLNEYYSGKDVPMNRRPKGIIVNQKYSLVRVEAGAATIDGGAITEDGYVCEEYSPNTRGVPYLRVLSDINKYLSWVSYMNINAYPYFNQHITDQALKEVP